MKFASKHSSRLVGFKNSINAIPNNVPITKVMQYNISTRRNLHYLFHKSVNNIHDLQNKIPITYHHGVTAREFA